MGKIQDANFRTAVLLKSCLLVSKTILLAFPEAAERVDVKYLWSCVPQLCPASCTRSGGQCVQWHGACRCDTSQPNMVLFVLNISTVFFLGNLTTVNLLGLWRRAPITTRRLLGIMFSNITYTVALVLAAVLPVTVFASRPRAAGVFAVPLVPMSLLINEQTWTVEHLVQSRSNIPAIREHGGSKIMLLTFFALVPIAVVILCQEVADISRLPLYMKTLGGKFDCLADIAIGTLIAGVAAAALLIYE